MYMNREFSRDIKTAKKHKILKKPEISSCMQEGFLKSTKQPPSNAGEDVWKQEFPFIVRRIGYWGNHSGSQYGESSKKKKKSTI